MGYDDDARARPESLRRGMSANGRGTRTHAYPVGVFADAGSKVELADRTLYDRPLLGVFHDAMANRCNHISGGVVRISDTNRAPGLRGASTRVGATSARSRKTMARLRSAPPLLPFP